jgi:hypothetical protein
VAAAQTGQNVQSAIANSYLGNINQVGPYGSTTYSQGATHTMPGANGETYQVPQFTQTRHLIPKSQWALGARLRGSRGANLQVGVISGLSRPFRIAAAIGIAGRAQAHAKGRMSPLRSPSS